MNEDVRSPLKVGKHLIKNRFVCPPMGTNFADKGGYITNKFIQHYKNLINSGCGMIIIEAVNVEARGMITDHQVNAYHPSFVSEIGKLAAAAQSSQVLLIVQLCHGGIFGGKGLVDVDTIAPSDTDGASEMSIQDLDTVKRSFVESAVKVQESGADGIEIHMAHGYLLAEFISGAMNKRTDRYGGKMESRLNYPLSILREIRRRCGKDFLIQVRISATEGIDNGMTINNSIFVARLLELNGADCIHVSCGVKGSGESSPGKADSNLNLLLNAKEIKKNICIPVIAVGKINTIESADYIIKNKISDLVAVGRPLLMDCSYVEKLLRGQSVRQCLYCNRCLSNAVIGKEAVCLQKG